MGQTSYDAKLARAQRVSELRDQGRVLTQKPFERLTQQLTGSVRTSS